MKKIRFLKQERFLISLIVVFGIFAAIITVASKSILSRSNIELERVKKKVENINAKKVATARWQQINRDWNVVVFRTKACLRLRYL